MCPKPFLIYFLPNSYSNRLYILWGQSPYSIYNCVLLNTLEIECYKCWSRLYKSKGLIVILLSLELHPSNEMMSYKEGDYILWINYCKVWELHWKFAFFSFVPPWSHVLFPLVVSSSFLCLLNLTWRYEFRILTLRPWLSDFSVLYCWPQIEIL